jgi:hypothetical protein
MLLLFCGFFWFFLPHFLTAVLSRDILGIIFLVYVFVTLVICFKTMPLFAAWLYNRLTSASGEMATDNEERSTFYLLSSLWLGGANDKHEFTAACFAAIFSIALWIVHLALVDLLLFDVMAHGSVQRPEALEALLLD